MALDEYGLIAIVRSRHPRNSLFIQAQRVNAVLEDIYGIRTALLAGPENLRSNLRMAIATGRPVLFHYGSFEPGLLNLPKGSQLYLVYHNHTPLKYYWYWGEKAALLDILTVLQLRCMAKSRQWIAESPFNVRCLAELGYRNIQYCPCVVTGSTSGMGARNEKASDPTVIYAGHISPSKNTIHLVEEMADVATRLRQRIVLRIIGDVKSGSLYGLCFRKAVARMAGHEFLVVDWVREFVTDDRLADLLASSWLYVSCSRHEGFGLPACEAICNGTPALYLECGGQESVLDGYGSTSSSQPHAFRNAALELLSSAAMREELLGRQEVVVRGYCPPGIHENVRAVFDRIVLMQRAGGDVERG